MANPTRLRAASQVAAAGKTTQRAQALPSIRCLSSTPHMLMDGEDLQCHFFGCLRYDEREKFWKDDDLWIRLKELDKESQPLIPWLDAELIATGRKNTEDGNDRDTDTRYASALALKTAFRQVKILRQVLKDSSSILITDLVESAKKWEEARAERLGPAKQPAVDPLPSIEAIIREKRPKEPDNNNDQDSYSVERDVKSQVIFMAPSEETFSAKEGLMEPLQMEISTEVYKGRFPDQYVSIEHLLGGEFLRFNDYLNHWKASERNSMMKPHKDSIRYFHMAFNNMTWVKQAMECYFRDSDFEKPGNKRSNLMRPSKMVLKDDLWRGQEHGSNTETIPHSRYLRCLCESFGTDPKCCYMDRYQDNMVLFMPYLHWETDRNQSRYTEVMDKTTGMYECKERECLKMQHKALRDKREQHCSTCGERSYACIPRVTHDDRDPYHVEKDVMLPQKAQRDPALLCTTSTPRKLDEVFEVKMRQEWKRKGNHTKTSRKAKDVNSRANGSSKSKTGNRPGEDLEAYPVSASEHSESSTGGEMISNDEKDSGDENDLFLRPKRMRQLLEIDEIKLSTRRLKPAHPLARYFIDAARLYEAMASFKDQKVLEAYLFPGLLEEETDAQVANEGDEEQRLARLHRLHPRRTLDQSYFWSLRSTRNRDKDQVVYRYTQAKFPHRLTNEVGRLAAFKAGGGSCLQQSCTDGDERATDWPKEWKECNHEQCKKWKSRDKWRWEGHTKYEDKFGCEQCREDIRQVARVVMVDQLWMWILDRNTILTCFPRRYGVPRKDPSGVHHSVRKRLKDQTNSSNHVRSVFDLALIILDECFDTFFDRQKKPDKRPQVMDIFSESIGDVANKQVIAMDHLRDTMNDLQRVISKSADGEKIPDSLMILLDVGRESELQHEIRDIIDELNMMINVARQQEEMIKRFIDIAQTILKPRKDEDTKFSKGKSRSVLTSTESTEKLLVLTELDLVDSQDHDSQTTLASDESNLDKVKLKAFQKRAADLKSDMWVRMKELESLRESADTTAKNVENLLTLKQQQASVVQAYQAIKQGRTTVIQGKNIMAFTILTIIFLPMSFFSSLFGMNNPELSGGGGGDPGSAASNTTETTSAAASSITQPPGLDPMTTFAATTFRYQVLIIFTLSFPIVVLALLAAFASWPRRVFHFLWKCLAAAARLVWCEIKLRGIPNKYEDGPPKQWTKLRAPNRPTHRKILDWFDERQRRVRTAQYDKVRVYNESRQESIERSRRTDRRVSSGAQRN